MASSAVDLSQFASYAELLQATSSAANTASPALKSLSDALEQIGRALHGGLTGAMKAFGTVVDSCSQQIGNLGSSIRGLVQAGLQGTQEGNRLSFAWMLLTKQIASVFLPVINALTAGMQRLTGWFQSLSGDGQHIAMVFGGVAAAFSVLAPVLAKLSGFLSPLVAAWAMLAEGLMQFFQGTAEGQMIMQGLGETWEWLSGKMSVLSDVFKVVVDAVVVAFQGIVRAFTWVAIKVASLIEAILDWIPGLGDATASVRTWKENAQKNLDDMMATGWGVQPGKETKNEKKQVGMANGQFEGLGASFQRVTEAANKMSGGPEAERHNQAMQKQEKLIEKVGDVAKAIDNKPPMLAR